MSTTTIDSDTHEVTRLEKLRTQLSGDIEMMQQKEASMREYEKKLRDLVEQASAGHTASPLTMAQMNATNTADQAALDTGWQKHERANALLEAARASLTDERLALKDREQRVSLREKEVARREAALKAREDMLNARLSVEATAVPAPKPKSAFSSPLLAAKNLLSMGK